MDAESKIKIIGEKLYIQLFLLEKKFINSVKIKYDEKLLNFLFNYYKNFYYSFSNFFITITNNIQKNNVIMNNCNKNINPCNFTRKNKSYKIIVELNNSVKLSKTFMNLEKKVNKKTKQFINEIKQEKMKKIKVPLKLFDFQCKNKNVKLLEKFIKKIKNILNKDNYLKKIIKNVEFIEN